MDKIYGMFPSLQFKWRMPTGHGYTLLPTVIKVYLIRRYRAVFCTKCFKFQSFLPGKDKTGFEIRNRAAIFVRPNNGFLSPSYVRFWFDLLGWILFSFLVLKKTGPAGNSNFTRLPSPKVKLDPVWYFWQERIKRFFRYQVIRGNFQDVRAALESFNLDIFYWINSRLGHT